MVINDVSEMYLSIIWLKYVFAFAQTEFSMLNMIENFIASIRTILYMYLLLGNH